MLPGFRFLFAAIVLSMSILIFGLGAAALLRAAHEEFASTPSWHASPEPVFAQRTETTAPVLAMLRVDPPAAEEKAPDQAPAAAMPDEQPATSAMPAEPEVTAKPAEPEVAAIPAEPEVTTATAEPEKTAASQPENASQPETAESEPAKPEAAKPEMPVAQTPVQQEPPQAIMPAATDETKMAISIPATASETPASASEEVAAPAGEAAPAASAAAPTAPEPASPPASADADTASTKIATLGGPSVTIETPPPAKTTIAKHVRRVVKKRVEARRKTRHRRIALRARVVQQLPQQPTDPFGQQFAAARRR